ncbi:MAG TPA: hypothetical protein VE133_13550, partial [Candidatus Sulfotelmatobacter sp.]|nr:hypothetical protein [Candidatus Sulfotelmatobacter sp.]
AEGLKQLHVAYELDAQQEQRMRDILGKFKQDFNDLPQSERGQIVNGFETGLSKVMPTRQRAITTEKAWIDSLDEIYTYAQSHHSDISMSNGRLVISSNPVREEFNIHIRAMNARRAEFVQAKDAFDKMQAQSINRMGVSREQTGLH